jgi:hypothetical protein
MYERLKARDARKKFWWHSGGGKESSAELSTTEPIRARHLLNGNASGASLDELKRRLAYSNKAIRSTGPRD